MSDRISYHYSLRSADDAHDGHAPYPRDVILKHFPDAADFDQRSVGDCWFFTAERRDDVPPFVTPCGTDGRPMWGWHGSGQTRSGDTEGDRSERDYVRGSRAAIVGMLRHCLRELGYDDSDGARVRWVIEREETVAALRRVCATHGDNDWPPDLHLADVIEKHLRRHLERP